MSRPLVLIIEDDEPLSRVYSIALQDLCETKVINDGAAALEWLNTSEPDVVLLDLNLPTLPGETILIAIRQNPRLNRSRVILCTGDERQADWLDVKADFVLLKPISPIQLRALVSRLVNPA